MFGVNVGEGSGNSVGGEAGVVSLWSGVGIIAPSSLVEIFAVSKIFCHVCHDSVMPLLITHHFPIKVSRWVIRELAQTRVKGAVT